MNSTQTLFSPLFFLSFSIGSPASGRRRPGFGLDFPRQNAELGYHLGAVFASLLLPGNLFPLDGTLAAGYRHLGTGGGGDASQVPTKCPRPNLRKNRRDRVLHSSLTPATRPFGLLKYSPAYSRAKNNWAKRTEKMDLSSASVASSGLGETPA